VCRHELTAEQKHREGNGTEAELRQIHNMRRQAAHSLISMFIALRGRDVKQELRRIRGQETEEARKYAPCEPESHQEGHAT